MTYHGRPLVPSVRDGGCSGMSLAYDLLDMVAVLGSVRNRGRSKAREVEFMMLSLMLDMVDSRVWQSRSNNGASRL